MCVKTRMRLEQGAISDEVVAIERASNMVGRQRRSQRQEAVRAVGKHIP